MRDTAYRLKDIELSQIRKMFEMARADAINLGLGEPDFDTPWHIREAVIEALKEGFTHYTPNQGIMELREALADKLKKENNIQAHPEEIIVTVGASEALFMSMQALINPADEVLIPDPGFLTYEAIVKICEGKPIPVPLKAENDYAMTLDDVEELITPKTKAIILNSPSNPTGSVMEKEEIKGIAQFSQDKGIYLISDEVYEKIIYGVKHYSPGEFSDKTITINGFSKTYAMTGFRIGYTTASQDLIDEMLKVHQYNTACATSISQRGALSALEGPQDSVEEMRSEFKRRRDLMVTRLKEMGWEFNTPQGAFYIFPQVSDSQKVVNQALENKVVMVPGAAFGQHGENHVRMSYANAYEELETALDRLENIEI